MVSATRASNRISRMYRYINLYVSSSPPPVSSPTRCRITFSCPGNIEFATLFVEKSFETRFLDIEKSHYIEIYYSSPALPERCGVTLLYIKERDFVFSILAWYFISVANFRIRSEETPEVFQDLSEFYPYPSPHQKKKITTISSSVRIESYYEEIFSTLKISPGRERDSENESWKFDGTRFSVENNVPRDLSRIRRVRSVFRATEHRRNSRFVPVLRDKNRRSC